MKRSLVAVTLLFALGWHSVAAARQYFHYVAANSVDLAAFPPPPSTGSMVDIGDLNTVLWMQQRRTCEDAARARKEQDQFTFELLADVLGPSFSEANLPKTAELLKNAISDAEGLSGLLKDKFHRPRPFENHREVHPVVDRPPNASYPSGHSTRGTVIALILAELIPAKATELKQWGCAYGLDRVIGGVHYPSDVVAGRQLGTVVVEVLLKNQTFEADLAACKIEIQKLREPAAADAK